MTMTIQGQRNALCYAKAHGAALIAQTNYVQFVNTQSLSLISSQIYGPEPIRVTMLKH